jgi:hypothetical protein
MYNRLKIRVNKVRSYGPKWWNDQRVVKRMIRAYPMKDITLCSLIHENLDYKKMIPDDVLAIIINYQKFQEEANFVKNLSKGIPSARKQDITLKASKKSKRKQVIEESSSEEEDETSEYDANVMCWGPVP